MFHSRTGDNSTGVWRIKNISFGLCNLGVVLQDGSQLGVVLQDGSLR
jgi:hypothetical protein